MTIKELREKYNLTQSALARTLGVSSNAISGIEGGRIKLSNKMSAKIKEVYGEEVTAPGDAPVQKAAKEAAPKKATEPEAVPALEKKDTVEHADAVADEKVATEITAPAAAPAPEKKRAKKSTAKKTDKAVTSEAVAPAPEKKATKKAAPKKAASKKAAEAIAPAAPAPEKKAAKKASPKKPASEKPAQKKAPAAMKAPTVILQSPLGGEVSAEEILSKVGEVDKVYVRIDQNKLYWVKGKETGNKDIW